MAGISLDDYQLDAVKRMKNGCILCGGVGSGKSRTALAYYYIQQGGIIDVDEYLPMNDPPKDLYIITTARKRDTFEWEQELAPFLMSTDKELNLYANTIVIDSWNKIGSYTTAKDAFFIFDEQRVVGSGAWVNSFLKIAKRNEWILLSATPGDKWMDYVPVFIANGFYKNRTEFIREHVVYKRFSKFPQVDFYLHTGKLLKQRNDILVTMDYHKETVAHHEDVFVKYDVAMFKDICRNRWDPWKNEPIKNASEFCQLLRKVVNTDVSRQTALMEIFEDHPKLIIFYNFDYELIILRGLFDCIDGVKVAEWNGHKHQPIPKSDSWVYLVNYAAGAEGWNCTETDTLVFYSLNYSYRTMIQASGRIDRRNTPFKELWYYHLKSRSGIDLAISRVLDNKQDFNERVYCLQALDDFLDAKYE